MSEDDFDVINRLILKCQVPTCDSTFQHRSSLLRHMRSAHKDGNERKEARHSRTFNCDQCSKSYSTSSLLQKHCTAKHGRVTRDRKEMKCAIELCKYTCRQMKDLIVHLNERHDQHLEYEHIQFRSQSDCKQWQAQVEKEIPCQFLLRKRGGLFKEKSYHYCNRSGSSNLKASAERKRHVKTQGSCKIGRTCTAHFVEHRKAADVIEVKYMAKHFCHTNEIAQLGNIRLPESDRTWLSGKLAQDIPLEIILRDVRSDLDGSLKRCHIVTKQDLRNIQRAFHLNRPERFHSDDATSVHALVQRYENDGNSPILLYKRQHSSTIDICHEGKQIPIQNRCLASDFLFGFMDDAQCDMLKRFGNGDMSVICMDSTHGTNGYDFHLSTIMVLDSYRQGFPVAFLYSNRETEEIFHLFLQAIKHKSGIIRNTSFMSDMAPQCYNAWKSVMGKCQHQLFCAWHMDKSFRENTRRLIKDNAETVDLVYKQLRTVMDEQDIITFESAFPLLVLELQSNPVTADFAQFVVAQYVPRVRSWAYCYRARCGINTNMHLERMHGIFKHIYQRGKRNKRLDAAIAALMSMVNDRQFDRITSLCKGKYSKKLSEIRSRHEKSLKKLKCSDMCTAEVAPQSEWVVQSESNSDEMYSVKRVLETCEGCDLDCKDCRACIHLYSCTCPDNATQFNMCKHIHIICQKYPCARPTEREDSSDENTLMISETENAQRISEATAHITQLSHHIPDLEKNRRTATKLCSDVALCINEIESNEHMISVIECLKAIKPKLQALTACSSSSADFVLTTQSRNEPHNKAVEPQRRFLSTKKKRVRTHFGILAKPSTSERREIQNKLLLPKRCANHPTESDLAKDPLNPLPERPDNIPSV